MKRVIETPKVWSGNAPYSTALRIGDLLFVSGQVAVNEQGETVGIGDIEAQTRQVFDNLAAVLGAASSGFKDVVKLTYFVREIDDLARVTEIRREYLTPPYPTATAVEVSRLVHSDWLIEVEAIAVLAAFA